MYPTKWGWLQRPNDAIMFYQIPYICLTPNKKSILKNSLEDVIPSNCAHWTTP